MSCKRDGVCNSAAACFINGGCLDESTERIEKARESDARYRQGYADGWKDAIANKADKTGGGE